MATHENTAAAHRSGFAARGDVLEPGCKRHTGVGLAVPHSERALQGLHTKSGGPISPPAGVRLGDVHAVGLDPACTDIALCTQVDLAIAGDVSQAQRAQISHG
ncbi:hypothetical protein NHF46_09995 [Arthrobacter alpinus]|nr:hypothetical protein [Arthrobacter alpinus]